MEQKEIKNTVFELKKDGFYMNGDCLFSFDYIPQEEIKFFKKDFEKIISYQKEKEIKKMTIQNITDFYFSQYENLVIKVEMFNGVKGKYNTFTKEGFREFIDCWQNEKVITANFATHYTNYATGHCAEREIPILYICYKSNDIK